ncbi:hypothetical protein BDV59DRAFT_197385 [Aspergillus ambiguus]|uniref:uncharacterized protein n=1 Tax=Aspergillus ambiguus TaxID=176160 RepID=UPI003CCE06AD
MSYQLTPDDLNTPDGITPAIQAARNPNPAVLRVLLDYYLTELPHVAHIPRRDSVGFETCSPNADVSGAIDPAGADPTDVRFNYLSDYSARFIRGRDAKMDMSSFALCPPREKIIAIAEFKGIHDQIQPLTEAELDERRLDSTRSGRGVWEKSGSDYCPSSAFQRSGLL